jgi:hypothetical protein
MVGVIRRAIASYGLECDRLDLIRKKLILVEQLNDRSFRLSDYRALAGATS